MELGHFAIFLISQFPRFQPQS